MRFSKQLLKGAADVIVMKALDENGEAYGYQLIKTIAESSDNIFEFQEGTLYPLLYRLEHKKLINSYQKTAPNGKTRRYYRLTDKGRKLLVSRAKELTTFVDALKQSLHLAA